MQQSLIRLQDIQEIQIEMDVPGEDDFATALSLLLASPGRIHLAPRLH
jgi:hypothetical protein